MKQINYIITIELHKDLDGVKFAKDFEDGVKSANCFETKEEYLAMQKKLFKASNHDTVVIDEEEYQRLKDNDI